MISSKSSIIRRSLTIIGFFFAIIVLASCENKEAMQRKAFIDFLQNTVLRSGSHPPALSEDQRQKFGHYAGDYAILAGFAQQLDKSLSTSLLPAFDQINSIHNPQDYLTKREALQQSLGAANLLSQQLQTAQQQAENARAALKLPDDLKTVFNQAYEQIVNSPVNTLRPAIPTITSFLQDVVQVGDFLQSQGSQVSFANGGVQLHDPQQVAQYNALMKNLVAKQPAYAQAQQLVRRQVQ